MMEDQLSGISHHTLTERHKQILDYIKKSLKSRGVPPSIREIGVAVNLRSSSSVHLHLRTLERLGYLKRTPALSRSMEVTGTVREEEDQKGPFRLALVKELKHPESLFDNDNILEHLSVPFSFQEHEAFLIALKGETLRDVGIFPGDLLVVRIGEVENGDVAAALQEDQATFQRYYREASMVRLEPENRRMRTVFARNLTAIGKVVGMIRRDIAPAGR